MNQERSAFTGNFFAAINFVAALFQFTGVPLLFKRVPLSRVLAAMPALVLSCCAVLLLIPALGPAALLLFAFKVTEYVTWGC